MKIAFKITFILLVALTIMRWPAKAHADYICPPEFNICQSNCVTGMESCIAGCEHLSGPAEGSCATGCQSGLNSCMNGCQEYCYDDGE
jgi:hypothetical protein